MGCSDKILDYPMACSLNYKTPIAGLKFLPDMTVLAVGNDGEEKLYGTLEAASDNTYTIRDVSGNVQTINVILT